MINCIGVSTRDIVVIQVTNVYLWSSLCTSSCFTKKKNEEQDALHFKRMKCTKQNYTFHFNHLSLLRNEANDINSYKCVLCVYVKIGHC